MLADSNCARLPTLNGVGFPSCTIRDMTQIAKSIPIPFFCDTAILCFSVSHVRQLKKNGVAELVAQYLELFQALKNRFGNYLIAGARPNNFCEIPEMQRVSRQLGDALAHLTNVTVVDIFSNRRMREAAKRGLAIGRSNRGGIIHFTQNEARIFHDMVNMTISSQPDRVRRNQTRRKKRCYKKEIKVHENTVAVKISRNNACPYTRHLYDKYYGRKFAAPSECNEHTV